MSNNDTTDQESNDEEYECHVEGCDYTSRTAQGVAIHFGNHDDATVKEALLDELQRLTEDLGHAPTRSEMCDYGAFSSSTYQGHFGSWNAAVDAAGYLPPRQMDIPSEDLLDELRRVSDELGHRPTRTELREYGEFSSSTYERRFGGLVSAVEEAGIDTTLPPNISSEDLLNEIQRLADDLGHVPSSVEMSKYGDFGITTYCDRFGSWNAAVEDAGFTPNYRKDIPTEDLLNELHRLDGELGHTPSVPEMNEYGTFHTSTYSSHFGSWNAAIKAAGLELNHRRDIPKEEYIDALQRLAGELGRTPSAKDMTEHGAFHGATYFRHFESWNAAIEEAGLDLRSYEDWVISGEEHYKWVGGTFPYGEGWTEAKKEQVRERDNRTCQNPVCGRTEEEHIEEFGRKHSVHHIQKARNIDDPEKRNHPDNLITLCHTNECHLKWEKMSPLRPQVAPNESDG